MQTLTSYGVRVLLWMSLVVMFSLLVGLVIRRRKRHQQALEAKFNNKAAEMGLVDQERDLLLLLAKISNLRDNLDIFSFEPAFTNGASLLMDSPRISQSSTMAKVYVQNLLNSLRQKLGFRIVTAHEDSSVHSSRQIDNGTVVTISNFSDPHETPGTIIRNDSKNLVIKPAMTLETFVGQRWFIHYTSDGTVWEFDTTLEEISEGNLLFTHSQEIRKINRRSFPRVPVSCKGRIAAFPFFMEAGKDTPDFKDCEIIEIAGPGLKLVCPPIGRAGENVLLAIYFQDKSVQAFGHIHRYDEGPSDNATLVVTLPNLDATELAELANQTRLAQAASNSNQPKMKQLQQPTQEKGELVNA